MEFADLHGANLENADLRAAYLELANFKDASLEGADLERAHLLCANLEHADLERAHLEHAYLTGAHLAHTDLTGAHLERVDLRGAHLRDAHFSDTYLDDALLTQYQVRYLGKERLSVCRFEWIRIVDDEGNITRTYIKDLLKSFPPTNPDPPKQKSRGTPDHTSGSSVFSSPQHFGTAD